MNTQDFIFSQFLIYLKVSLSKMIIYIIYIIKNLIKFLTLYIPYYPNYFFLLSCRCVYWYTEVVYFNLYIFHHTSIPNNHWYHWCSFRWCPHSASLHKQDFQGECQQIDHGTWHQHTWEEEVEEWGEGRAGAWLGFGEGKQLCESIWERRRLGNQGWAEGFVYWRGWRDGKFMLCGSREKVWVVKTSLPISQFL